MISQLNGVPSRAVCSKYDDPCILAELNQSNQGKQRALHQSNRGKQRTLHQSNQITIHTKFLGFLFLTRFCFYLIMSLT